MQNLFSFRETPFWKYCFRRLFFFFLPSRGVVPKRWTFCRFCFGKALTVRGRRFVGKGNCRGYRHWNRHLPRSITPPLKHLADCSVVANTAWRRPRRSRGSPQIWNCVPANFSKTLGSGWFLSCGRTSCEKSGSSSTCQIRAMPRLCSRARSNAALSVLGEQQPVVWRLRANCTLVPSEWRCGRCQVGVLVHPASLCHGCSTALCPRPWPWAVLNIIRW